MKNKYRTSGDRENIMRLNIKKASFNDFGAILPGAEAQNFFFREGGNRLTRSSETKKAPADSRGFRKSLPVFESGLRYRLNRYKGLAFLLLFENDHTVSQGEERVVFADTYVFAGVVLRAALTHDNIAGNHLLAAKHLDAESFAFRFAAVLYFTFTFFVCHGRFVVLW